MKTYAVDVSSVHSLLELHQYLKEVFSLPEHYGMNMDALWDCLYCTFSETTLIEVKNISSAPSSLSEPIEILRQLFLDLAEEDPYVEVCFL